MESAADIRRSWRAPGLTRFTPSPELVRLVLDSNGIVDVPPALRHLLVPAKASASRR